LRNREAISQIYKTTDREKKPLATSKIPVYLEMGSKRTFAGAMDWPGWCRSGRDETAALQALADYGPRYAQVLHASEIQFVPPADAAAFEVGERLAGTPTTDFGAPDVAPETDAAPLDEAELQRLSAILQACWRKLDAAVAAAAGKPLRKGPRGGGREADEIAGHVRGAELAYLSRLAWKVKGDLEKDIAGERQAVLEALAKASRAELPSSGPRGGKVWVPRYFVRRVTWHILDHAWEIEDRI
jgi:hypothetical protein